MKWIRKEHEFDEYAQVITEEFRKRDRKIYIFGAGLIGLEVRAVLEKYQCFAAFIDNDYNKQQTGLKGSDVISLDNYKKRNERGWIVIAADTSNIPAIEKQLCESGLKKSTDFYDYHEFLYQVLPILSIYEFSLLYMDLAQISLTERCSLKCKNCAHGCYAVGSDSKDMDIEAAKRSADCLLQKVDVMREFVLIGGEPFLYQEIASIITYIGEKYRDKMVIFSITTNGTIIPGKQIIDLCRKYNVLIRISNYSAQLRYLEAKYEKLCDVLRQNKVSYVLGEKEWEWKDYGFGKVNRKGTEDELRKVFDCCNTQCREVRENRFYYCVMARSISENLQLNVGENDYLDLNTCNKKQLMEFQLGYSEKGYLEMCNYCNGADAENYPIPPAEQIG